jgi:outer membrane protein OmpA-like peptidoglycan-associated protein
VATAVPPPEPKFSAPVTAPPARTGTTRSAATLLPVFFDWDSAELTPQAYNIVTNAAANFQIRGGAQIAVIGHTDTTGPEAYNKELSLRRANAIKQALVKAGVPAASISVVGKGKTDPPVDTADEVESLQNRRVEIQI